MKYLQYIVCVSILAACGGADTKKDATADTKKDISVETVSLTEIQLKNAGIEAGVLTNQTINEEIKLNGTVDVPPQNIVSVSFPMGGYLKSTKLLPGLHVNKGEAIAVMEDQGLIQLQQDYLSGLVKLNMTELELTRQKELRAGEVNAAKVYQLAKADYEATQIMVKGLSEKLKLIGINPDNLSSQNLTRSVPIYSPINGFVAKVNVNIGKFVNPSDVLFELIDPNDIHAALTVFEKDIAKIAMGQKVKIVFADEPNKVYDGEVILISRNIDENRSGIIHCHFETKPKQLLPGMFLNARVMVNNVKALTIPEEGVVRFGNQEYVFEALSNTNFKMIPVTTGVHENGFVAITAEGLNESKQYVRKNAYAILSKMKNTSDE